MALFISIFIFMVILDFHAYKRAEDLKGEIRALRKELRKAGR